MIYRECEISPEYVGFGWHHTNYYDGPDDNGNSIYCGHDMTVEGCQSQIDEMYAEHLDDQDEFQLWAGTRV